MKIVCNTKLSDEVKDKISKAVEKKIKPNMALKTDVKVKVDGVEITGDYRTSIEPQFDITKIDGQLPTGDEQRKAELMKMKKDELIEVCKLSKNIKFETDMNKSTLIDLIIANDNGQ